MLCREDNVLKRALEFEFEGQRVKREEKNTWIKAG